MWIGAYLCLSAILLIPGLFLLSSLPSRRAVYLLLSSLLSVGVLILYMAASIFTGLLRVGVTSTYRYPQDYIEFGPLGWVIMILLPLGVVSPLLLAGWLHRKGWSR